MKGSSVTGLMWIRGGSGMGFSSRIGSGARIFRDRDMGMAKRAMNFIIYFFEGFPIFLCYQTTNFIVEMSKYSANFQIFSDLIFHYLTSLLTSFGLFQISIDFYLLTKKC